MDKRGENRRIGRLVVGIFVVGLVAAILYVIVSQSGILPGDVPVDQRTDTTVL